MDAIDMDVVAVAPWNGHSSKQPVAACDPTNVKKQSTRSWKGRLRDWKVAQGVLYGDTLWRHSMPVSVEALDGNAIKAGPQ